MSTGLTAAVVLDLDDTLYLERDYVRSGFDAVGVHLARMGVMDDFAVRAWAAFEGGLRGTIFDEVLRSVGSPPSIRVSELVEVYRSHEPRIELSPDAARFLTRFPSNRPLGMITDGPVICQLAKVRALGLERLIQPIVMSDSFGVQFRKPHDHPFATIEDAFGIEPVNITYIADNPLKDFITPRRRGWRTIRMLRPLGEHAHRNMQGEYAADEVVDDFDQLFF